MAELPGDEYIRNDLLASLPPMEHLIQTLDQLLDPEASTMTPLERAALRAAFEQAVAVGREVLQSIGMQPPTDPGNPQP